MASLLMAGLGKFTGGFVALFAMILLPAIAWASTEQPHSWLDVGIGLDAQEVNSHFMLGFDTNLAVMPADGQRLKLVLSELSNNRGPESTTVGYQPANLSCLSNFSDACNSGSPGTTTTGGNSYSKYDERTLLYEFRLLEKPSGGGVTEMWAGLGGAFSNGDTRRYQIDNGSNTDTITQERKWGAAGEVDIIYRRRWWHWQTAFVGETGVKSYGMEFGFGVNF